VPDKSPEAKPVEAGNNMRIKANAKRRISMAETSPPVMVVYRNAYLTKPVRRRQAEGEEPGLFDARQFLHRATEVAAEPIRIFDQFIQFFHRLSLVWGPDIVIAPGQGIFVAYNQPPVQLPFSTVRLNPAPQAKHDRQT
jgi:hypothetical protein